MVNAVSLAIVNSRAVFGIEASPVTIEVHLSRGLPGFRIVGMPEIAVRESKDRVRSAIINSQFEFPIAKIIVNLAPADLPKEGGRFDLPIALGILAASKQIPKDALIEYEFAGELALTGELRAIQGALPLALATSQQNHKLILPTANVSEAALIKNIILYPAAHLLDVCAHLLGREQLAQYDTGAHMEMSFAYPDLVDVIGQVQAKRSLEIAAAGGHSLLFIGPPGAGKTMLASRLPGILPPMTEQEALEVAAVYSISHSGFSSKQWCRRPFRAPHHTASAVALVGGGNPPKPGEISLAHCGVLFLDELPEFNRHVLDVLREPIELGSVSIARASYHVKFPASVQLIAAMNPCPCGYYGDRMRECHCTADQVQRYQQRLSGPLLDRFDMHVEVAAVSQAKLIFADSKQSEMSEVILKRVLAARSRQMTRANKTNAQLLNNEVRECSQIEKKDMELLQKMLTKFNLSARAYYRVLKLARTIADLENSDQIQRMHWQEAVLYRKTGRILMK